MDRGRTGTVVCWPTQPAVDCLVCLPWPPAQQASKFPPGSAMEDGDGRRTSLPPNLKSKRTACSRGCPLTSAALSSVLLNALGRGVLFHVSGWMAPALAPCGHGERE